MVTRQHDKAELALRATRTGIDVVSVAHHLQTTLTAKAVASMESSYESLHTYIIQIYIFIFFYTYNTTTLALACICILYEQHLIGCSQPNVTF